MDGKEESKVILSGTSSRIPAVWETSPNHPLYLHHSDQTGNNLIGITLEEDNYASWEEAIVDALRVKSKVGFLNGILKQPDEEGEEKEQWIRCNIMVKHWLLGSMSKPMQKSVARLKSAEAIWRELKERFSQAHTLSLFEVERAITRCAQGTLSVVAYYTKLKTLWDEKDSLIVIPSCVLDDCAPSKAMQVIFDQQRTLRFLDGLNDTMYTQLRNSITSVDPLPSFNKVYAQVLRHEKQEGITAGKITSGNVEASAFAVKTGNKKTWGENESKRTMQNEQGSRYCENAMLPHIALSFVELTSLAATVTPKDTLWSFAGQRNGTLDKMLPFQLKPTLWRAAMERKM